jgi:type II secretory pathway pseudopilin PulG
LYAVSRSKDSLSGFSLLEAVVALTIVGLAATSSLAGVAAGLRTLERVRGGLVAHALAEERLARIALLTRSELDPLPDSLRSGRFAAPFQAFGWTADARGTRELPDVFEVSVRLEWQNRFYELSTKLFRPRPRIAPASRGQP